MEGPANDRHRERRGRFTARLGSHHERIEPLGERLRRGRTELDAHGAAIRPDVLEQELQAAPRAFESHEARRGADLAELGRYEFVDEFERASDVTGASVRASTDVRDRVIDRRSVVRSRCGRWRFVFATQQLVEERPAELLLTIHRRVGLARCRARSRGRRTERRRERRPESIEAGDLVETTLDVCHARSARTEVDEPFAQPPHGGELRHLRREPSGAEVPQPFETQLHREFARFRRKLVRHLESEPHAQLGDRVVEPGRRDRDRMLRRRAIADEVIDDHDAERLRPQFGECAAHRARHRSRASPRAPKTFRTRRTAAPAVRCRDGQEDRVAHVARARR